MSARAHGLFLRSLRQDFQYVQTNPMAECALLACSWLQGQGQLEATTLKTCVIIETGLHHLALF